jgi:tetratricopeptide (TPR) repeat protein
MEESLVTPTAVEQSAPPAGAPSAGLVAYSEPDDDQMLVRTVAYPHMTFTPAGMSIEMFRQGANLIDYTTVDRDHGYRLRVNWQSLWMSDTYGISRVEMTVYLRYPGSEEFVEAQYAITEDFERSGADFANQLLDSTLYLSEPGEYGLRAVAVVWMVDGNGVVNSQEHSYETTIVALNSPGEFPTGTEDLQPAFGDVVWEQVLLDWRGWRFGPCFIQTDDNPEATRLLDEACVGVENGDTEAAANALQAALDVVGEDPALQGRLRQQLGTLAAEARQWNVAVRHFTEALEWAQVENNAFSAGIALHNLGISLVKAGFQDEGQTHLYRAAELRDQIEDWIGANFSWGQFGFYWEDVGTLEYVATEFQNMGLPQADVLWSRASELHPPEPTPES